jgi:hypothetical protein
MNYQFLLYSFLFAIAAIAYYLIFKLWSNAVKKKEKAFYKPDILLKKIIDLIIIIGFGIASLMYLFKAVG